MARTALLGIVLALAAGSAAFGQTLEAGNALPVVLVVEAGRTLRIALDDRVRVRCVGQPVIGTLTEPLYAFDRIVVPAGSKAEGHVESLEPVTRGTRIRLMLGGDFTPVRGTHLRFDALVGGDGTRIPLDGRVISSAPGVLHLVADGGEQRRHSRLREAASREVERAVNPIVQPRKMERLKSAMIALLPYHPQYLDRGTVYTVQLATPLTFGTVVPTAWAAEGARPHGDSLLDASLRTRLDSEHTARETAITAVLTAPVFADSGLLIFPAGTELRGHVTFARPARRFRRNGQLRFLFQTVQLRDHGPDPLLASLHGAELARGDRVAIDEEGGARVTNPKARFVAPGLALVAAHASVGLDPIDAGEVGNLTALPGANVGGRAAGGFAGLGVIGMAVAQVSRPVAGVLGFYGLGQTVYTTLLGRGRDVIFAAGTPLQLQLSPTSARP